MKEIVFCWYKFPQMNYNSFSQKFDLRKIVTAKISISQGIVKSFDKQVK